MLRKQKMFLFAVCTVVLCIFFSPTNSFADTLITTNIDTDTTWTLDASPYIVSTDIHVADTATLTIEPGVQVLVAAGAGITIDGSIVAQGTSESHISFETSTLDMLWGGISLSLLASGDFNYVDFAHTNNAISADDADLSIIQSSFTAVQNPAQITFATRFVHSGNTFLQTSISGWNITEGTTVQDITLLAGDGIYYISGSSTINQDTTGTIAPGVQISIAPNINMLVLGTIQSIGTADAPIDIDSGMNSRILIYGGIANFLYTNITNTDLSLYTASATFLHSTSVDAHTGIAGFESMVRIENSSITNTLYDGVSLYSNSSVTIKDAAIVSSKDTAVYISNNTTADMHNVRIDLTSGAAIFITNQSTLFATDVQIHNAENGLSVFTQSTATIKNIDIGTFGQNGILMGDTSKTTITDLEISHGFEGIHFFDHSSLDAAHIHIHDVAHGIVMNAQNYNDAKITVRDSEIYNISDYALRLFDIGENADIHNNSFYNTDGKNVVYIGNGIDISGNW